MENREKIARVAMGIWYEVDVFKALVWRKAYYDWWRVPPYMPAGGKVWHFSFGDLGTVRAPDLMWRVWTGEWIEDSCEFVYRNGLDWDFRIRNLSVEHILAFLQRPQDVDEIRDLYLNQGWEWRELMTEFRISSAQLKSLLTNNGSQPLPLKGQRSRRAK